MLAKKVGVYNDRSRTLNDDQTTEVARRAAAGETKAPLAREFSTSLQTIYEYLPPSSR
ncbi:MAG: helix-turn-helix domain-containing protein [Actinomycetales bacterium]